MYLKFTANQGCTASAISSAYVLDNPDVEILSINYSEDPPCGTNIDISLSSDIDDIQPTPQSNVNYGWNFSWDNGIDPDNWEQNPTITIPFPTNDTVITLWAYSTYFVDGEPLYCYNYVDSIIKTYPAIDVSLTANPLEECEPFEFYLDGSYSQIGSSNILDPLDSWHYLLTNNIDTTTTDLDGYDTDGQIQDIITPTIYNKWNKYSL